MADFRSGLSRMAPATKRLQVLDGVREVGVRFDWQNMVNFETSALRASDAPPFVAAQNFKPQRLPALGFGDAFGMRRKVGAFAVYDHTMRPPR